MCKKASLEFAFKNYLSQVVGAENLDGRPEQDFPRHKADYYLASKQSVFEVKSISSDRIDALEPWLQKRVETSSEVKNGMPVVFGSATFKQIYEKHTNKKLFIKQLDSLASRTLEDYVRKAKNQIHDTKKALGCTDAFGFLVILNQGFEFYETWFVYHMIQDMLKGIISKQPERKIDGVWYINESTVQKRTADVIFIHESNELDDITPNKILNELQRGWAVYRGYLTKNNA